jgi:hypothetical protein
MEDLIILAKVFLRLVDQTKFSVAIHYNSVSCDSSLIKRGMTWRYI